MNTLLPIQLMSRIFQRLMLMFIFTGAVVGTQAQTAFTATYNFSTGGNDVTSLAYNGTAITGVTPSAITKVGCTSSSSTGNFRGTAWGTGATNASNTFTGSVDLGKYFQFSITPVAGYTFTITSISFGVGRSATGPRQFQWRGSADSYGGALSNYTTLNASATNASGVLTVPDANSGYTGNVLNVASSYSNQSGTSTFRIYAFNAESAAGTGGLQGNLTITGTYSLSLTTPSAPTITGITPGNGQLSVAFTAPSSNGGSALTNYKYSTDGGSTFTAVSPAATTSPIIITGLTNGTSYNVQIRAVNAQGDGTATATTAATPYTTPDAPTITGITPGNGQLSVAFTAPSSNGGAAISNYKFSTDGGTSFTAVSPVSTSSPILITGLTNGVTYDVQIKAVNIAGDGAATATMQGTPVAPVSPSITVNPATLPAALTTTYGTASASTSFTVSAAALTGNITITAPTGFEVFDGATYVQSFSLTPSAGVVNSTTVQVRLRADALVTGTYNSQLITVSGGGASAESVSTTASENSVSPLGITITGVTATDKTYDRTTTLAFTGTAQLVGVLVADVANVNVAGTPAFNSASAAAGTQNVIVTGYTLSGSAAGNYSLSQPTGLTVNISKKTITIIGAVANDKPFDGTTAATISGTLSGVENLDVVTLNGTGTFNDANIGTNKPVTSTSTLGGADANNYQLQQPTGLTASITAVAAGLLVLEENFEYTSGSNLTSNGWTAHSGAGTSSIKAGGTPLSYSGYGSPNLGLAAVLNASGEDVHRTFNQQAAGTTTYVAFLMRVATATTAGDYVVHLAPSIIGTEFRARVYIKNTSGALQFGISSTGTTQVYASNSYAFNTTYLVVVKHSFTGTSQTSTIYINPDLNSEIAANAGATATQTTALASTNIGSIALRQSSATNSFTIDAIRVGTGYAAVVGNPTYSSNYVINAGNYNNVTITSNALTQNGSITVNGTLNYDGKLDIGSNTLTLAGPVTSTGTGGLIGSSNAVLQFTTAASGTVYFDQTTDGSSNAIKSILLNKTSGSALAFGNKAVLLETFNPQNGSLNSNGFLHLRSTDTKTAQVATGSASGQYITGDVTVERYIPQNSNRAWRLLSVPTLGSQTINEAWQEGNAAGANGTPGYGTFITGPLAPSSSNGYDFNTPSANLLTYNPNTNQFVDVTNTNNTLTSQSGYFLYIRGDRSVTPSSSSTAPTATTLRTKGPLFTGDQAGTFVPVGQFALIGNVYASAIDFTALDFTGGAGATINKFYLWDPKVVSGNSLGIYQTFSASFNNYEPFPGGGSFAGVTSNTRIESGAAFFVYAAGAPNTNARIALKETSKVSGSNNVFRPATPAAPGMQFKTFMYRGLATSSSLADANVVVFNSLFSNAVDADDALKLSNNGENLGILRDGNILNIEARQPITNADTIFYTMWNMQQQQYRFDFIPSNMVTSGIIAFLQDKFLGTTTPLDVTDTVSIAFTVTADPLSSASDRFRVVFKLQSPVPVNFTSVSAAEKAAGIQVDWMVAQETGVHHYDVEFSTNGRSFTAVGQINATGNNGAAKQYQWLHTAPVVGNNYYRIKSVDVSGATRYSYVVKVITGKQAGSISITPNPVKGTELRLQFTNQLKGRYTINVLSVNGQTITSANIEFEGGSSVKAIALPSLAAGIYQVEIIDSLGKKTTQQALVNGAL